MPLDKHYAKISQTQKEILQNFKLAEHARLSSLSTDFKIQNTLNQAKSQFQQISHQTQGVLARQEKYSKKYLEMLDVERESRYQRPTAEIEFRNLFPDEFVGDSKAIRQQDTDIYSVQQSKKLLQRTSEYQQLLKNMKSSNGKLYDSYVIQRPVNKYTQYTDFLIDMDQLSYIDASQSIEAPLSRQEITKNSQKERQERLETLKGLQKQQKVQFFNENKTNKVKLSEQQTRIIAEKLKLLFQLTGFFNKLKLETNRVQNLSKNEQNRYSTSKYQSHVRLMRFLEDYQNIPGLKIRK